MPTVIQRNVTQGNNGVISLAFGANVTAGNAIIVIVGTGSTTTIPTPTDTGGDTFVLLGSVKDSGNSASMAVFACYSSAGGAQTISVNVGAGTTNTGLHIREVSGLASASMLDGTIVEATGFSSPVTAGATTTANANDLLLGFFMSAQSTAATTWTTGTGYSNGLTDTASFVYGFSEEQVVSATGTYAATAAPSGGNGVYAGFTIALSDTPIPVAPTTTTQAASGVTEYTATGNGTITSVGTSTVTERGIVYDTTSHPTTPTGAPFSTAYPNDWVESGSFSTGAFTESITGLTKNTTYYARAYAGSLAGYGYGAEISFTTLPGTPLIDKFSASDPNLDFWDNTNGSDKDPFPSGETIQYTIPALLGLNPGTTYYWRVRAKDPASTGGSDTWGAWSATRSFTVTSNVDTVLINESSTVAEVVTVARTGPTPLSLSVSDTATSTTSVSIQESATLLTVNDSSTHTESASVAIGLTPLAIAVSDAVTLTEAKTLFLPTLLLNVAQAVSVTDTPTLSPSQAPLAITVSESVSLYESSTGGSSNAPAVGFGALSYGSVPVAPSGSTATIIVQEQSSITVSDAITTTAVATLAPSLPLNPTIYQTEAVAAGELVSLYIPQLYLQASDSITVASIATLQSASTLTVSDTLTANEGVLATLSSPQISQVETSTTSENVLIQTQTGRVITDATIASEAIQLSLSAAPASVVDTITSSETYHVVILSAATTILTGTDAVSISETITLLIPVLPLVTQDNSTINDTIALVSTNRINVSDVSTTSTNVAVAPTLIITTSDTSTVSDAAQVAPLIHISLVDTANISDSSTVAVSNFIVTSEPVLTSDSTQLYFDAARSLQDVVTLSEAITLETTSYISLTETSTASDDVVTGLGIHIQTSDSVGANDSTNVHFDAQLQVTAASVVTETITLRETSYITTTDSSFISEMAAVSPSTTITQTETISVTDTTSPSVETTITAQDSSTASDTSTLEISDLAIVISEETSYEEALQLYDGEGIYVTETSNITDDIILVIPLLYIGVSDSATITDSATANTQVTVTAREASMVTDNAALYAETNIEAQDDITTTDISAVIDPLARISVSEALTSDEFVALLPDLLVFETDAVTYSETTALLPDIVVRVSDISTGTDIVSIEPLAISLAIDEQVSASDTSIINFIAKVVVTETSQLTDTIVIIPQIAIAVSDAITTTETVHGITHSTTVSYTIIFSNIEHRIGFSRQYHEVEFRTNRIPATFLSPHYTIVFENIDFDI